MTIATVDLSHALSNNTSQYGEDGIIAKIFETIGTTNRVCVEFGGADIKFLSNTYSLWNESDWTGLYIEGDYKTYKKMLAQKDIAASQTKGTLHIHHGFVLPELGRRVSDYLAKSEIEGQIDLLVVDIDGGDYYILEAFDNAPARVLIVEINATFPPEIDFVPEKFNNAIGSSAAAICRIAKTKGYTLVACTKGNCVFVVDELANRFAHAGDLAKLFDYSSVSYVFKTLHGGAFFSNVDNPFGYNPFDRELANVPARFYRPPNTLTSFMGVRAFRAALPVGFWALSLIRPVYSEDSLRGSWWEKPLIRFYRRMRGTDGRDAQS